MWKFFILIFLFLFAQKATSVHTSATVELAIFCDFEFCERFHHNETKIREFWAFRIYDTNLRFKTLPSVVVNFVVTSLTLIKSKSDQDFIEQRRDSTGNVSISSVLRAFSIWVNDRHRSILPAYNIALLALGANTNDNYTSKAYINAACVHTHQFAVVRFTKDDWWSSCGSLEFGLSTVLGALSDSAYSSKCHDPKYVKGRECNSVVPSIFDEQELNAQPPSIREQCILLTNNSNAWVNSSDENLCFSTICYSENEPCDNSELILYPIDNSPCETNKSCFRGRCIQNGFQIQHTVSLKCLHSSNLFRSDDNLHLIDCPNVPTALDRFMIFEKEDNAVLLATAYSSADASENSDKCMWYDVTSNSVRYQNCYMSPDQTYKFEWNLVGMSNEFLIRHKSSQLCLVSLQNDGVGMENCSSDKGNIFWNFVEEMKPTSTGNRHTIKTKTAFNFSGIDGATSDVTLKNSVDVNRKSAVDQNSKHIFSKKTMHSTSCMCCTGYWMIYLGFGAFIIVTVILSMIVYKLHKRNKELILGYLVTQDFHELSRIIASEEVSSNRI